MYVQIRHSTLTLQIERRIDMYKKIFEEGFELVKRIQDTQEEAIKRSANLVSEAFLGGHTFYVSGSGHSHTLCEEFYGRAGGLAFTVPILTSELTMTEHPTKSSYIERLDGYAAILCELFHVSEKDVVMIASNSGRNAYPVELAECAKKKGASVIAITNVTHSQSTTSRAKSGKRLMDVADVVIDNCGVLGDACLDVDGVRTKMMPTSSIANSFIAQAISVLVAQNIANAGKKVPVFVSLNGIEKQSVNDELYKKYTRLY